MVLPGRIATERVAELDRLRAAREARDAQQVRDESERSIPTGRDGRPEELAALVAFLCGRPAGYVNGEQVRVDGGLVRAL